MLPLLLLLALQSTASLPANPAKPLEAVTIYDGSWTFSSAHTLAGPGKTDSLVNHCTLTAAFYACEQVVNGKPMALIVFTPGDGPNLFHTQIVLPDGHATGRGDLAMVGDKWTFSSKDVSADEKTHTFYRTENTFTGRDRIHFEQFESKDGVTWAKTNQGDEVRTTAH